MPILSTLRRSTLRLPIPHLPATLRTALLAGALLLLAAAPGRAIEPINQSFLGGVAIDGYDPVAYFTEGIPVEGNRNFTHEWQGATWRFASAAHRDTFAADPTGYAPQFGGYCAWAVGNGYTADIDPEAWSIVDGKLYLNYNREVQAKWEADRANLINKANGNWPTLLAKD